MQLQVFANLQVFLNALLNDCLYADICHKNCLGETALSGYVSSVLPVFLYLSLFVSLRHLTKTTWFWRRETSISIHILLQRLILIPILQISIIMMSTNGLLYFLASCNSPVPKACATWLLMWLRLQRWSSETFQAPSKSSMSYCCQKPKTLVCDMMFSLQSARLALSIRCSYSPLVLLDHSWRLHRFSQFHKLPVRLLLTSDKFWPLKKKKLALKAVPWVQI